MSKKIHFIGGGEYKNSRGFHSMLRGWAYCCSGDKAARIKENGNGTYDMNDVTCDRCWDNLLKSSTVGKKLEVTKIERFEHTDIAKSLRKLADDVDEGIECFETLTLAGSDGSVFHYGSKGNSIDEKEVVHNLHKALGRMFQVC